MFGAIVPNSTSHEIRGQNIVVRLLKLVEHINWPRLLNFNENNQNIKHSFDQMQIDDEFIAIETESEPGKFH